jgi:hypothetical protein
MKQSTSLTEQRLDNNSFARCYTLSIVRRLSMGKRRIFTIGFELPGTDFEFVPFDSNQSLLDADIILCEPGFANSHPAENYEGTPLFDKFTSVSIGRDISHWRSELALALQAGKLVIVYLTKPLEYFHYTGEKEPGTGQGRGRGVALVARVSSYDQVSYITSVEAKSGTEMKLTKEGAYLASYWKEFGASSRYEAFIQGKFTHTVLTTKQGGKIVAAAVQERGWLLFLPPLRYDEGRFLKETEYGELQWTAEAQKFGKRLVQTIVALADTLAAGSATTPPPEWAQGSAYETTEESELRNSLDKVSKGIARLEQKRTVLQQQYIAAGTLRHLLYEQGKPLEDAVRQALNLFGFEAMAFQQDDSEFDVVFESIEGRFLGEVEGKDNRAIDNDKLRQLEQNIQEDFSREDVNEHAKGVLFGNPERLIDPSKRGQAFTSKCIRNAQRAGVALVRTADLFEPARYLRTYPDPDYAKACREAIFATSGAVVEFPTPPIPAPRS